jgi:hypothetical protein
MTDERSTEESRADERNDRLAERLRVEPLDEVTRARLVRTAMAAAPAASSKWSARTRVLGVAAALVVLLAVGLAVVLRDDSTSGPTAADAPKTADAAQDRSRSGAADELQQQEFSARSRTGALGDLGEVGSRAALRRAIGTAPAPTVEAPAAATASTPNPDLDVSRTLTVCKGALDRLGEVVAVGTGTADGEPVTVYVVEQPTGSRVAVVVGLDCTVGKPVSL